MHKDRLKKIFTESLQPPATQTIYAWANANLTLGAKQSTNFKGQYRAELTPYVKEIYDALQNPYIRTVSVAKGAQTALTTAAYVWLLWTICNDAGAALVVMPSVSAAQSASENRLMPLINDSPTVAAELDPNPDTYKKLEYQFKKCNLRWVGSNSAAQLASRPARYLLLDELDKFPLEIKNEASAVSLAIERTKTFYNRKVFLISTPTIEDGFIWQSYLQADQRKYFIPCPACGVTQVLSFKQIRFNKDLPEQECSEQAFYECENENCKHHISDSEKIEAVKKGKWIATATSKDKTHVSYHLPSWYAPWVKWSDVVTLWLKSQDYTNELRNVINSTFAEPWVETKSKNIEQTETILEKRKLDLGKGELLTDSEKIRLEPNPADCKVSHRDFYKGRVSKIYLTVDVQKDHLLYLARQWVSGGDSSLVTWGTAYSWQEIDGIAQTLGASRVAVDASYGERAQEVYEACAAYSFIPVSGKSLKDSPILLANINPYEGKSRQKEGVSIAIIYFEANIYKSMLWDLVEGRGNIRWHIYRDIEHDYIEQMLAEHKVSGKWMLRKKWKTDNHCLDLEAYQVLIASWQGFLTYGIK